MSEVYTLVATLEGTGTSRFTFEANDDTQATLEASFEVMDRAWGDTIWAKGRVELLSPAGDVVQVMEAK